MGQGALEEKLLGASKKIFNKDPRQGGLTKFFCLKREIFYFAEIILTPKINVIEYLVLRWTYLIKNANYEIRIYVTGSTREWSVNVTMITMIVRILNKSLYIFMKDLLNAFFFLQDNA